MREEQKKSVKNGVGRLVFVALSFLIQTFWIIMLFVYLNKYSTAISLFSSLLALIVVLLIYGRNMNAAFKMSWMVLILVFPVWGICLYLMFGHANVTKNMRVKFEKIDQKLYEKIPQNPEVCQKLEQEDLAIANHARYLWNYASAPVYQNTDVTFYEDTTKGLEAQKEALRKAEKFIFMEYHAIEEAESFLGIKDILIEKAKQGVEVRIVYDDVGSVVFINKDFVERMEKVGIHCRIFNEIHPVLNIFMNNRDHRKITVIDGKVGFTGGYNLANEYFNITHPYGYWKDTGVKLEGDAVKSFTMMFLEMWNAVKETDTNYDNYFPAIDYTAKENGYVIPYADSPLDREPTGENVYLNLIKYAKKEIYFTTPYLLLTDEMVRELTLAAKRGVDVRIVTPGIPDKKLVYQMTRSYYKPLVRNGVRIYEYTPGFLHAKQCVCDGKAATVGTINLDFRSLYLHFENGVYLYHCDAIKDIRKDFEELFDVSREVTEQYKAEPSIPHKLWQSILHLFSPLM